MFNVTFPGLGISVNVNPTAFRIGGHAFAWYGIIIAAAFLLAFFYAVKSCKRFHVDDDRFIDTVIVGIIVGVIGARLYFVLFDASSQYLKDPVSILYIWNGGLGIYGGIIGGLLGGALMAKHRKLSVPAVLDLASLGFLIGQSIGRWGNFVNQEAFGTATNLPWRMSSEATVNVSATGVHPCFLYESLWCLLGFILLHIFSRKFRRYDGQVFLLYSIWYGVGRFFIEGLRTDSLLTPYFPLRISQVVAAAAVIAGVVLLIIFRNRTVLTGCGSAKIMELNSIVDEVAEKKKEKKEAELDVSGPSTIFETAQDAQTVLSGGSIRGEDAAPQKTEGADAPAEADAERETSSPDEVSPEKTDDTMK